MKRPSLDDLSKMPSMTRWFNPLLLSRVLLHVIVSTLFGQYADRRLIHAALDHVEDDEFLRRADLVKELEPDEEGAIWIDYVSDLGDGFDATYAIAYLLAQESLDVDGHLLPRGQVLVMGGDQVYPDASLKEYQRRLITPYKWAYPNNRDEGTRHPPVFLIPGNHDWYDGLVLFLAFFCRRISLRLGNWRTRQRRSYFAIQLTDRWWIWAIDIQLMEDIDQPQADYFEAIANGMAEGSNIVLCTAAPGWLVAEKKRRSSFNAMGYVAGIANRANKELKVIATLSGDTHHYSRYSYGPVQFITAGGGGAFLHGTHQLKNEIEAKWPGWKGDNVFSLTTDPAAGHNPVETPACYPPRDESRRLLTRNLLFPLTNWDFAALLGIIYWLFAVGLTLRPEADAYVIAFVALLVGLTGYTGYQEGWAKKVIAVSTVHALTHFGAIAALTSLFNYVNSAWLGLQRFWPWLGAMFIELVSVGGLVGGLVFGAYLLITCRWLDMNHNDAFSAMRLGSYRHFLRIRIKGESVTIFPIGLDSAPSRRDWRPSEEASSLGSLVVPSGPLRPRLIESAPIQLDARPAQPVAALSEPDPDILVS